MTDESSLASAEPEVNLSKVSVTEMNSSNNLFQSFCGHKNESLFHPAELWTPTSVERNDKNNLPPFSDSLSNFGLNMKKLLTGVQLMYVAVGITDRFSVDT